MKQRELAEWLLTAGVHLEALLTPEVPQPITDRAVITEEREVRITLPFLPEVHALVDLMQIQTEHRALLQTIQEAAALPLQVQERDIADPEAARDQVAIVARVLPDRAVATIAQAAQDHPAIQDLDPVAAIIDLQVHAPQVAEVTPEAEAVEAEAVDSQDPEALVDLAAHQEVVADVEATKSVLTQR